MEEMMKKVLADILTIMNGETTWLESFFETVLTRLVSFGYQLEESDSWSICFASQKVENHIKNSCNTISIPDGLFNIAVDMVCGEFLFSKKQNGRLKLADLDFSGIITSIKEGDIQISFGNGASDDEKFNILLEYLLNNESGTLICYRQMKW